MSLARNLWGKHIADKQRLRLQPARILARRIDRLQRQLAQRSIPMFFDRGLPDSRDDDFIHKRLVISL